MAMTAQDHANRITQYREYYNSALAPVGWQAPLPKAGQKGGEYRRHALQHFADSLLPQTHRFAAVDWKTLPYDAVKNFEPEMLRACVDEYRNPANVPPGQLRMIPRTDPQTGMKFNEFYGQDCFTKQMMRPGRRVVSFRTDHGFVDAGGRALR
jgi:hypothetical protein